MIDARARLDDRLAEEARTLIADSVTSSALGGALAGAVLATAAGVAGQGTTVRLLAATAPTVAAALAGYWRSRSRWTRAAAADALERRHPADNLVVTAEALTRTASHPWQAVVSAAAWSRIESLAPLSTRAAWTRAAVAVGLVTAAAMMPWPARAVGTVAGSGASDPAVSVGDARLTSFSVVVSPPPYLGGESVEHRDATAVEVVAGGHVEVRAGTTAATIRVAREGAAPLDAAASGGMAAVTLPEPPDGTWVISAGSAEPGNGARLLIVRVVADAPPLVRIVEPGRDRRLARPLSDLRVAIDARDDHALRDVRLRVTTVSGSGENLTFADRDVEARVTRAAPGAWTASAILPLASLDLADGDLVVYRGVAADGRPGAPAVESDAFIVEVGPLREPSDAAGGGEDVDPEQRQAISQQMVIVKTERLDARGAELSPEVRLSRSAGPGDRTADGAGRVRVPDGRRSAGRDRRSGPGPRPGRGPTGQRRAGGAARRHPGDVAGRGAIDGGRHRRGARGRAGGAEVPAAGLRSPALPAAAGGRAGANRPLATTTGPAGSRSIAGAADGRARPAGRARRVGADGEPARARAARPGVRSRRAGGQARRPRSGRPPRRRRRCGDGPRVDAPGPGRSAGGGTARRAPRRGQVAAAIGGGRPDDGISGAVADAIRRRRP